MTQTSAPTTTAVAPPGSTASTTAPVMQASVAVPTTTPLSSTSPGASSAGLIGAIISGAFLAAMLAGAAAKRNAPGSPQYLRRRLRGLHRLQGVLLCHPASPAGRARGRTHPTLRSTPRCPGEGQLLPRLDPGRVADVGEHNARLISEAVASPVGPCMTPGTTRLGPQTPR